MSTRVAFRRAVNAGGHAVVTLIGVHAATRNWTTGTKIVPFARRAANRQPSVSKTGRGAPAC